MAKRYFFPVLLLTAVVSFLAQSQTIVDLHDFTKDEVKVAGFTLSQDVKVHITATGGGDRRSIWEDIFDDDRPQLYAGGWIIDADTRDVVWEMTFSNTSGKRTERKFDDDIDLKKGSYEVYYSAHGFQESDWRSNISMNIDRRPRSERRSWTSRGWNNFSDNWDDDHDKDYYDEFMEHARNWGITVSGAGSLASKFAAPKDFMGNVVLEAHKLGDGAYVRKSLTVTKDVPVRIYAIGEGRRREEMYDYGWIVNTASRKREWEMTSRNTRRAGGAAKNLKFDETVTLPKGEYEFYFVTDDSHSPADWNSKPPYDPYNHGIAIAVENHADGNSIKVTDINNSDIDKNAIVTLTKARDNDYLSSGFTLKGETKLRVYCIGEGDNDGDMADYGWIINAKTRERVWDMDRRDTEHAGGASKNRMVDEIITLPAGNYLAYYQTDGSHSYNDWNSNPPYDDEHYGLTVSGNGEAFNPKSVASFKEDEETDVLVQIVRARDDEHYRKTFTIERPTRLRVYALGEGQDRHMYDYGWIEDAKTNRVVWEMTYGMTERAGGARKNRLVDTEVLLEPGTYELHYETDDSHAYNDWNDDPPEDRTHWGITLYTQK